MIRLDEFGYCLEEYVYSFENNEIKEISYTLHNEKSQDVAVVGVYNQGGAYKRSLVLWPQNNPTAEDNGYLNEDVAEMKLYLDTAGVKFDFDHVTLYRYRNAKNKNDEEFTITVEDDNGRDVSIVVDKNNVAVYDSTLKIFKIYPEKADGTVDYTEQLEFIRITDFGVITETHDGKIYLLKKNFISIYSFNKIETDLELLEYQCTGFTDIDGKEYDITYDSDLFVESVISGNKLYSRNEGEEQISRKLGLMGSIKDSIYPTLITNNYQNYMYNFMSLWTHDKMKKDKDGNRIFFERRIYVVRSFSKILDLLRSNLSKLSINY